MPAPAPGTDQLTARLGLRLDQSLLGAERVLALLRSRGYALRHLELHGASCSIEVDVDPERRTLLLARLRRIPGVHLEARG